MTEPATPLDAPELRLPAPAVRGLAAAGYRTLGDVWAADDERLRELHGVGPKALRMIAELKP
ncbi:helix-hairpin-helix domain-containing protein [Thermoleophilia bacterium SCSIO 60948]|nr:helix-hairpin-helix domain-containing protein [Thermoleophilia bacterium SCSIO 60948]